MLPGYPSRCAINVVWGAAALTAPISWQTGCNAISLKLTRSTSPPCSPPKQPGYTQSSAATQSARPARFAMAPPMVAPISCWNTSKWKMAVGSALLCSVSNSRRCTRWPRHVTDGRSITQSARRRRSIPGAAIGFTSTASTACAFNSIWPRARVVLSKLKAKN